VASADKPFRFPATFTFVVRSFTVLDGIGKSLNPRFDISEIAAPYARGLLLEARPQFAKLADEFRKRAAKQASFSAVASGWRKTCCCMHRSTSGLSPHAAWKLCNPMSMQNRAVRNLFTGPNMIEDVAVTMASLRSGDLKLRVRALEAERALDRVQVPRPLPPPAPSCRLPGRPEHLTGCPALPAPSAPCTAPF
jgi:hypothetical protein